MSEAIAEARCAICGEEHEYRYEFKGGDLHVELSDVVFCDECRERLKSLLYPEKTIEEWED